MQLRTFDTPQAIRTQRLLLRQWEPSDLPAWTAMNQDLEVRKYLSGTALTDVQAREQFEIRKSGVQKYGWGKWAVERLSDNAFIGTVGVAPVEFTTRFTPAVELAWRLRQDCWGQGYAVEAAHASAQFAFEQIGLSELVAYTMPTNEASRKVMQRLGMSYNTADDFDHPNEPVTSPFCRHVLYRVKKGMLAPYVYAKATNAIGAA